MSALVGQMQKHAIYVLKDPITLIMHYLGFTSNVSNRLRNHKYNRSGTKEKRIWINRLKKQGMQPILEIVKEYSTAAELPIAEAYWYAFLVSNGAELYNDPTCIGGEAPKLTPEARKKIGKAQIGKKLSDAHKQKLSNSHKGLINVNKGQKIKKVSNG